ncbi:MAG TPA: tetratricopeptide repeat protein [Rhizomicrobium sp.]|nr:tetratricopeptide repeat protein [Rhizomicrobium sp.]
MNAPSHKDAWRVAALTMMRPEELKAVLAGSEAAVWVEAAAACGIAEAQVRLGRMLLEGKGVSRDARAAFACFLAAGGDAEALNMVGRCYENGWGVAQNFAEAVRHYRLAAEAGLAWAQYNLGHLLLDGNGVARDRDAAFRCYALAAAQDHERAMNLLARCHEEGWGTPRDSQAARAWYHRSAEAGYFRGAYNYATILLAEGCVAGALRWFRQALETAPEPTRSHIATTLRRHPDARMRVLI